MFFIFLTALCQDLTGIGHGCLDLLTHEEKPCTTMRTGMVRHTSDDDHLQICTNKEWKPYHSPLSNDNRVPGLIGHWKMDEQAGNNVADDSGYEHHGSASGPAPRLSKFSYGRYFNSNGVITIPNTPALNFGFSSFSVCGWLKIVDVTYPLTTYAVKKGHGCYYSPGRAGWVPGWETAHGYNSESLRVCIRDKENRKADKYIRLDNGYQPGQLIGKWVHHTVVFDRELKNERTCISMARSSLKVLTYQMSEAALTTPRIWSSARSMGGKQRERLTSTEYIKRLLMNMRLI